MPRFALLLLVPLLVHAKLMSSGELASQLLANGVPYWQLEIWKCIAYHESRFDTSARSYEGNYGIFQISAEYWCGEGKGKGCGLSCNSLQDDYMADDIACALKVYEETRNQRGNGFLAWSTYQKCL